MTCGKTQVYLAKVKVKATEEVNAKKTVMKVKDALELASQANDIYVAKGKKVVHLNMKKDKPDKATLTKLLLGPTGNLRAPTLRKGKTLIVGFDEATYRSLIGR
jgi:arsenate reductase-like glutaredoxin family protein